MKTLPFNVKPLSLKSGWSGSMALMMGTSVLRSLRRLLASDGFAAESFDHPETFLDYVKAHAVRVAILDVWMPGQTGIQLQELLYHLSPETRVIIITGRDEPASVAAISLPPRPASST